MLTNDPFSPVARAKLLLCFRLADQRSSCPHLQIKVPSQLAQVLKDYTKEVIRRQPEDLIEFSAHYFSNLANIIPAQHQYPAPSISQISHTYKAVMTTAVRTCEVRGIVLM